MHLLQRQAAARARQPHGQQPRVNGGAAELVDDDVRVLLRDQDVPGAAVELERDLVRHRRGRQEDRALLAEQLGDALLQLVDARILPHLLVADLGCGDRGAHARRRPGDGVGAQIDHGQSLRRRRRPTPVRAPPLARVPAATFGRDRDRSRRLAGGEGGTPVRAARGLDPRHAGARGARVVADGAPCPMTGPGLVAPVDDRVPCARPPRSCCGRPSRRSRERRRLRSSACSSKGRPARASSRSSRDAELIVVGRRGFGTVKSIVLGSVSSYVIQHATCPVLVIPSAPATVRWSLSRVGRPSYTARMDLTLLERRWPTGASLPIARTRCGSGPRAAPAATRR